MVLQFRDLHQRRRAAGGRHEDCFVYWQWHSSSGAEQLLVPDGWSSNLVLGAGWKRVFVNGGLQMGLGPGTLRGCLGQRMRWQSEGATGLVVIVVK